jgi:hypothetical protein
MTRRILILLVLLGFAAAPARASSGQLVRTNCAPIAAGGGLMAYNVRQSNNLIDARVGDATCTGSAPLPAHDGHRGAADLSQDGRWLLLETAVGPNRTDAAAEPGKGSNNAIQLLDRVTGRLSTLATGDTIWAKFSPDLSKIAWAKRVGWDFWDHYVGTWELHVADLNVGTGTITGERVWTPSQPAFVEPYGWLPGTNRVIFTSDYGIAQTNPWLGKWYASQLQTIPDDLSTGPTRFSPPFSTASWDWGCWCNKATPDNRYHEFAHFNGDGKVYTSIVNGDGVNGAMDVWSYNADGTGRTRVSFFGGTGPDPGVQVPGWPAPRYVVAGGMAWLGGKWIVGLAGDAQAQVMDAYSVTP